MNPRPLHGPLLALLLGLAAATAADPLATPPAPWAGVLQPVPEVDLSGAEPHLRQRMQELRDRLDALLQKPGARREELAEGFGTLAALYAGNGLETSAEQCFANARRLDPDNYRWPYLAAQLALNGGRPGDALERLQRVQALEPDYVALSLRMGQTLFQLQRYEDARRWLERAAKRPGLRAAALYQLGQIALLQRHYDEAAADFREALKLAPGADAIHYPLAQALRALGDRRGAMRELHLKGQRQPTVEDPLLAEMDALNNSARHAYGRALKAIHERRYRDAVKALQKGLEMDPENLNASVTLARALYLSGQQKAAEKRLRQVLQQQPDHVLANFLQGVLLEAKGDPAAAAGAYRKVLERDPEHAGAHYYLGGLLFRQGRYREAAQHFAQAAKAGPELAMAALYRLVALHRSGMSDAEVAAALEGLWREQPSQPLLRYALARLLAASTAPGVRNPARALKLTQGLLAQMPSPPHRAAHALALAAAGRWKEAQETLEQALFPPPWDPALATQLLAMQTAFQEHRLPPPWMEQDPLLTPPPANPYLVFAEYPAEQPY